MIVLKDDIRLLVATDGKYVIKKFKNLGKNESKELEGKLEIGKSTKIDGLITPIDYTLKNGRVDEAYYPFVTGRSFADIINENGAGLPLDIITKYFEKVEQIVKAGHSQEKKIVFPDLLSEGNVLYDEKTGEVNVIDYDDLQVGKYKSGVVSDFIFTRNTSSLLYSQKYYREGLYTKNFDLFSLYFGLVYYTTKLNFPRDPDFMNSVPGFLYAVGLLQTEAGQKMLKALDLSQDNPYLEGSLKQLRDNYTLSASRPGCPRQYVKK